MQTVSIGEITLQNGNKKKIFRHSGTLDFFASPASTSSKPKVWEIKVDDNEEIFSLDRLELSILSLRKDNESEQKYFFTAGTIFCDDSLQESEEINAGVCEGWIQF